MPHVYPAARMSAGRDRNPSTSLSLLQIMGVDRGKDDANKGTRLSVPLPHLQDHVQLCSALWHAFGV